MLSVAAPADGSFLKSKRGGGERRTGPAGSHNLGRRRYPHSHFTNNTKENHGSQKLLVTGWMMRLLAWMMPFLDRPSAVSSPFLLRRKHTRNSASRPLPSARSLWQRPLVVVACPSARSSARPSCLIRKRSWREVMRGSGTARLCPSWLLCGVVV